MEEEKAAVRKLFGAHKMPLVIELAITAAFVAFAAYVLYTTLYSDSARSKGISDSYLNVFPSEATVGEVLDDFFADGKCAPFILKLAKKKDLTINLRHLMDFGKKKFPVDVKILNTGNVVHSMEELLPIAFQFV